MTKEEILRSFKNIVADEVEDDDFELTMETVSDDIIGWDSIAHVGIVVSLEEKFDIKFAPSQITTFENVGAMVDAIQRLIEASPK